MGNKNLNPKILVGNIIYSHDIVKFIYIYSNKVNPILSLNVDGIIGKLLSTACCTIFLDKPYRGLWTISVNIHCQCR